MPKYYNQEKVDLFRQTRIVALKEYPFDPKHNSNTLYSYEKSRKEYLELKEKKKLLQFSNTTIRVVNEDTIDFTKSITRYAEGPILVLNLASDYMPGGGCRSGCLAQEEQLYYCTGYDVILGKHNRDQYYPLKHPEAESILTTGVPVLRSGKYQFLEKSFRTDFLALPALRRPSLENGRYKSKDRETMRKKIESIFLIAAARKYKTLVLGALGCGAYHNPVDEVVKIYQEMILKYKMHFDNISFAVLAKNSKNPNFLEFTKLEKLNSK